MPLRAGIGRRDISPTKSMFLVGYPHVERMSTGIHDPLFATALALSDGKSDALFIAVDILYLSRSSSRFCRERLSGLTGIPADRIMITASHTHSGPVAGGMVSWRSDPTVPDADPEYMEIFHRGIIEAGTEAANSRKDASLAAATAHVSGVGGNRHSADGVYDPEVGVICVKQQDALAAVQTFYSMHPTVLHEDSTLISSDFPGYARQHIENRLQGVTHLYHNGPSGNLSPRYHVTGQTFEEAERLGTELGSRIVEAVSALDNSVYSSDITLDFAGEKVRLVEKSFPPASEAEIVLADAVAQYEKLKAEGAPHGPVRTAECSVFGAEEQLTLAQAQDRGDLEEWYRSLNPAEIQAFRLGGTYIVGLPGEQFVEYSLKIKNEAPARSFVSCLANGELQGYIVTPGSTGYEATNGLFAPESGTILAEAALRQINRLEDRK